MLARKHSSEDGTLLPREWTTQMGDLLNGTYAQECQKREGVFDVYGQAFTDELLVIVSFISVKNQAQAPVTCFLSSDAMSLTTPQELKKTQELFIEIAGQFFDEIFANDNWDEWEPHWQEVEYLGTTYHYKISRENIALTTEADKLLREAGFDPDDTE